MPAAYMPDSLDFAAHTAHAPRLLLIEDDATTAEWIHSLCSAWGFALDVCGSAAESLRLAGEVNAVLMDQHLPDCDGISLIGKLREAGRRQPVIALSADIDAAVVERLQLAGFAAWLRKPFQPSALLAALGHVGVTPPRWDVASAISRAAGSEQVMRSLRQLLITDLPAQRAALTAALATSPADTEAVDAVLHRMLGGARLTGASALAAAIDSLRECLGPTSAMTSPAEEIRRLFACIDAILHEAESAPA